MRFIKTTSNKSKLNNRIEIEKRIVFNFCNSSYFVVTGLELYS